MEKVIFRDSKGRKIAGLLEERSESAVILCHGLGSHKQGPLIEAIRKALPQTTFSIDLLGHGESEGEYNDITLTEAMDDVKRAREYLMGRGYEKAGFVGHSFGAVAGIMAQKGARFDFLVLIAPPSYYDVGEILHSSIYVLRELNALNSRDPDKQDAKISMAFFRDYGSHDSFRAAEKIKAPALIIQGEKDNIVPPEKTIELHKRLKNSYLKIFRGADHKFTGRTEELVAIVKSYVGRHA